MSRRSLLPCIISAPLFVLLACQAEDQSGIPERIGEWQVEVGPPGNEFYDYQDKYLQDEAELSPISQHVRTTEIRVIENLAYEIALVFNE